MSSLATVFPSEGSANNSTEVEWRRRGSGPENSLKRQSHTGADKLKGWRPGDVWRGTGCDNDLQYSSSSLYLLQACQWLCCSTAERETSWTPPGMTN